jgi:hypothetical protein
MFSREDSSFIFCLQVSSKRCCKGRRYKGVKCYRDQCVSGLVNEKASEGIVESYLIKGVEGDKLVGCAK